MKKKPLFTVFTPTYNRAHTLHRVYESLLSQTLKDFEWLIVDDGSVDDTEILVKDWVSKNEFVIKYYKKINEGKHVAINYGVSKASGDLFVIFDSDDRCRNDSFEVLNKLWLSINNNKVAGIVTLSSYDNGNIIGNKFPFEGVSGKMYEVFDKYNIKGDKWNCIKTRVMKEFKFPQFKNEKFLSEGLIWNRISDNYIFVFYNEALLIQEYREDGLSKNLIRHKVGSPFGTILYYKEMISRDISKKLRTKNMANLYRYRLHTKGSINCKIAIPLICKSIGLLLYIIDTYKLNVNKFINTNK